MCHKNQNVILNRKNINKNKQTKAADKEEAINIIEIEGLLFPGFGQILAQCALHGKLVFPVFPIK